MSEPEKESEHDEEPITTTAEEKEEMLQIFDEARRVSEFLIGYVPELDELWITRENIETRSEAVLEGWKTNAKKLLEILNQIKRQYRKYRPSQRYKMKAELRILVLQRIREFCDQSDTPPPEKSSETMQNVEMECDRSNEASGSVVKKVGTEKRSARLSGFTAPAPEPEPVEDNTKEVEFKSASEKSKKKKKSHKKSKKKPQTADTLSQDPNEGLLEVANEQSSESKDSSKEHDDTATTFSKTEIASEMDLGPNETPECSKNVVIKQEVPVNFRLHNETEIIDVDADDDDDQIIFLNELTEEEQQKVRDEIEPQLSSGHVISPITLLRSKGKYQIVSRKSKNKKADAPATAVVIKEEPHYLDIFDDTEIIEMGSDGEENTKAFSDMSAARQAQIRNSVEDHLIEQIPKKSLKIKIFTQSDIVKIINEATGVTITKILKPKPRASASEEENEIDQPTAASQQTQFEVPKFNFDLNKNPFEIPKNNLSFPHANENETSQEVPQTHNTGVFRFDSDNQVNPFKEAARTTFHFAAAGASQMNVSGNVSGASSVSAMQIDPQTTSHNAEVFRFGSDSQMSQQENSQQFVPPEGTSANRREYSVGYVEEAAVKSKPEEEPSSVKDEMLSDEYLSDDWETISHKFSKSSQNLTAMLGSCQYVQSCPNLANLGNLTEKLTIASIESVEDSRETEEIKDEVEDTDEEDSNAIPQTTEDSLAEAEAYYAMYSTMHALLDDMYAYLNSLRGMPQPSTSGAKQTEDRVNNETQASAKALIEPPPALRPWIRNDHLRFDLKQLEVTNEYLLMNFKCQDNTCTFATNNIMHLLTHFEEHANSCNDLYVYSCSYCRYIPLDPNDYVQHFVDSHMSSRIQCARCLFRSISPDEFRHHWTKHHDSKDHELLVVTQDICAAKSTDDVDLQVKCCGCSDSYFLLKSLKTHIEEDHSEEEGDDTCKYCGSFVKGELYIKHLNEEHNIGFFHCLDCQYGSNLLQDVTKHISSEHPDDAKGFTVRTLSD